MTRLTLIFIFYTSMSARGQILPGTYVDRNPSDTADKCATLQLNSNGKFRMVLFDQKGNHWVSNQILTGMYSISKDSLRLTDTLTIGDGTDNVVKSARHLLFLQTVNGLQFVSESFDNMTEYYKRAEEIYDIKDDAAFYMPSLKPCGLLTWKP